MRGSGTWAMCLLAFLLLSGCVEKAVPYSEVPPPEAPDCSTPRATVEAYLESQQGFGEEPTFELFSAKAQVEIEKMREASSFEIVEETVDGDQATVRAKISNPPFAVKQENVFILRKEGGKWKIVKLGSPDFLINLEDLEGFTKTFTSYKKDKALVVETEFEDQREDGDGEKVERDVFESEKAIRTDYDPTPCWSNLRKLYLALTGYKMRKGKGRYFPRAGGERFIVQLVLDRVLEDPRVLLCPSTGHTNMGVDMEKEPEKATDYRGLDNSKGASHSIISLRMKKVPATKIPLVWDKKGNHPDARHVLFLDGHIEQLTEKEFQESFGKYE